MNERRPKPATSVSQRRKDGASVSTITHCVVCNYESRTDFDVCPRCKARNMAVLVIRRA